MHKRYISGCLVLLMLFCDLGLVVRPAAAAAKVNVALNKAVTVSSEDLQWGGNKEKAVDGKGDTYWSASTGTTVDQPQWVMIDLLSAHRLTGAEVLWKDDVIVQFVVETSMDQANWTVVADYSNNVTAKQKVDLDFQEEGVRYVRVRIPFYGESGKWSAISELQIWGEEEGRDPAGIASYDAVNVTTVSRIAPVLPNEVMAHYGNGKSGLVPVAWEEINPSKYASAGSFTVTGDIYGAPIQPEATVTVEGYRSDFVRGVDISTLTAIEDNGGYYLDSNGAERDLLDILKDRGVNYVRLRLWNDPQKSNGYNDKEDVIRLAQRVKAKGMKVLLDFHYSDEWAHPGQQLRPKAWENFSFDELKNAVYDYTREVVSEMKDAGAMPDMVQIGNEINSGVLNGLKSNVNFDENVALLQRGVDGVRDVPGGDQVKIMIHLAEGGKADTFDWYFGELQKKGLQYDIIGLSYYPFWHGTFADVRKTMNEVSAKYGKEVIIAETSYPFSYKNGDAHGNIIGNPETLNVGGATFPATVQGQYDAIAGIMDMISQVPDQKGAGFFYWEPAWIAANVGWIASEGDAWENHAMFDYDEYPANGGYSYEGRALPSLDVYKRGLDILPADRKDLSAAITHAKALESSDFTSESWTTLAPAIAAAENTYKLAYTSGGITQQDTDAATATLHEVMQQLDVIAANRNGLEAIIAEAKTYKQADWSAATWAVLTKALTRAEQVMTDPRATQTEVNTAAKQVEAAIHGLSNVDKTELTQFIGEIQQLTESSYTQRSWANLKAVLLTAITVRDKQDAVQSEVQGALTTLQKANNNLVLLEALTAGKTATASSSAGTGGGKDNSPGGAIDSDPTTSWGTDQSVDSWWQVDLGATAVIRKLEMSMWSGGIKYKIEVSNDNKNFVKVVDTTSDVVVSTSPRHILPAGTEARYIKLTITAGSQWVGFMDFEAYGMFPADKSALGTTVDSAAKLHQNDYTAASWNVFAQALSFARVLMDDTEASAQEISAADNALKEAVSQLVRQESTTGQPSQPGQPAQPSTPGSSQNPGNPSVTPPVESGNPGESGSITFKGTSTGAGSYVIQPDMKQLSQTIDGMGAGSKKLTLIADVPKDTKAATFRLNANQLQEWARTQALQSLELIMKQTSVRISLSVLKDARNEDGVTMDVILVEDSTANLSEAQKKTIGNRNVVSVDLLLNGQPLQWTDRSIEIAMSNVQHSNAEDVVLVIQSLLANGEMKPVTFTQYDEMTQSLAFKPLQSGRFVITEVQVPLNDLQSYSWAIKEVQNLYGKGIISGMTDTRFSPQAELTRAQFLQMIMKGIGESRLPDTSISALTDVKNDQWYTDSVRLGLEMGIVQGRADGSFAANERITREDMAVMLNRAIQVMKQNTSTAVDSTPNSTTFNDNADIAEYAKQAVASMQEQGLLRGMADGTFAPKQHANRAQGAVAVARMLEQIYKF
ncbi:MULTISPECIES: glycosyl hydrolase 53 family protein [unclassified Paenibacillus]|uniref:glycosyl hydrolase 53 family protein n=1 Tax=unclassified Paenibacillus TaxID=185978 RepID=UPI0009A5BE58|nr:MULTISPECIES: glycosyl hydrolase 53 family protein [unclassified Paenibacillus]SLJ90569.1 Arabinogalactan endo-1,4-beta-galactosidase [Paenibacillus sp. RU5A]SOC58977.1 Arabinogalactan endo-1,4-beta-galactosidase [Paenibacillus sp. RU26A]SOC68028.1 Arabinogalactan endo-1,4-beta-galactosidase [Paenibacillus sp. RU5M]